VSKIQITGCKYADSLEQKHVRSRCQHGLLSIWLTSRMYCLYMGLPLVAFRMEWSENPAHPRRRGANVQESDRCPQAVARGSPRCRSSLLFCWWNHVNERPSRKRISKPAGLRHVDVQSAETAQRATDPLSKPIPRSSSRSSVSIVTTRSSTVFSNTRNTSV
jgi:hypothetical protein